MDQSSFGLLSAETLSEASAMMAAGATTANSTALGASFAGFQNMTSGFGGEPLRQNGDVSAVFKVPALPLPPPPGGGRTVNKSSLASANASGAGLPTKFMSKAAGNTSLLQPGLMDTFMSGYTDTSAANQSSFAWDKIVNASGRSEAAAATLMADGGLPPLSLKQEKSADVDPEKPVGDKDFEAMNASAGNSFFTGQFSARSTSFGGSNEEGGRSTGSGGGGGARTRDERFSDFTNASKMFAANNSGGDKSGETAGAKAPAFLMDGPEAGLGGGSVQDGFGGLGGGSGQKAFSCLEGGGQEAFGGLVGGGQEAFGGLGGGGQETFDSGPEAFGRRQEAFGSGQEAFGSGQEAFGGLSGSGQADFGFGDEEQFEDEQFESDGARDIIDAAEKDFVEENKLQIAASASSVGNVTGMSCFSNVDCSFKPPFEAGDALSRSGCFLQNTSRLGGLELSLPWDQRPDLGLGAIRSPESKTSRTSRGSLRQSGTASKDTTYTVSSNENTMLGEEEDNAMIDVNENLEKEVEARLAEFKDMGLDSLKELISRASSEHDPAFYSKMINDYLTGAKKKPGNWASPASADVTMNATSLSSFLPSFLENTCDIIDVSTAANIKTTKKLEP
jgi:hypothetical protein